VNDYGTEQDARALNGLEETLKKNLRLYFRICWKELGGKKTKKDIRQAVFKPRFRPMESKAGVIAIQRDVWREKGGDKDDQRMPPMRKRSRRAKTRQIKR
jgi:hypothetical protein